MINLRGFYNKLRQYLQGMNKEKCFKAIFEKNYPKVIRLCMGYVNDREGLAQDLAQEVFIKAWQNLPAFRDDATLSTWIYRITVNTCLQELRRKKVRHSNVEAVAEESLNPNTI